MRAHDWVPVHRHTNPLDGGALNRQGSVGAGGSGSTGGGMVVAADVAITDLGSYFTGTDVEAALQELGAGGSGATLLSILGWYDAIVDGGLAGDGTTDDTSALNSLLTTATASGTRSCVIYFPGDHTYLIAGNVTMPSVSTSDPQITIAFIGAVRPPQQPNGPLPAAGGYSIIRGTATTGVATFNGGTSPTPNNIAVVVKNLLCIGNDNPTITFWNLEMTYPGSIEDVVISVSTWTGSVTYPTHYCAGITTPVNLHSNGQNLDGVLVGGYYVGIKLGELERGRNLVLGLCVIGLELTGAQHAGIIESLQITGYTYGIYVSGTHYLDVLQFDTERRGSPYATTADIYDPSDQMHGYVRWWEITAGVGAEDLFDITGGANVLAEEIGPSWGGSSTSFATPAIILGTAAAAGAASTAIRSDSTIVAFDATDPTTSAIGDSAATGSQAVAARRDHKHGREALSTATPLVESGAGAVGTGVKSSREDHVHPASTTPSGLGPLLLASDHGGPIVFDDILQASDYADLLYASEP